MYSHWLAREKKGLSPFIVLKGSPHHGESGRKARKADKKGKKKVEWVDVEDDDMEVDGDGEEEFSIPSDVDEQWPVNVKVGPPTRKKYSTEDPSQIAGPSKPTAPTPPLASTPPVSNTATLSHTPPAPEPLPKKRKSKKTKSGPGQKKDDRKETDNPQM